jgi:hypothetical protein
VGLGQPPFAWPIRWSGLVRPGPVTNLLRPQTCYAPSEASSYSETLAGRSARRYTVGNRGVSGNRPE